MFSIAWGKKTVRQYRHPNQICPVHDWRESHGNLSTGDSQFLPINAFRFKSGTCIRRLFLPACPNEHNRKNPKKWVVVREDVSWANLPGQLGEPTTLVAAQPRKQNCLPTWKSKRGGRTPERTEAPIVSGKQPEVRFRFNRAKRPKSKLQRRQKKNHPNRTYKRFPVPTFTFMFWLSTIFNTWRRHKWFKMKSTVHMTFPLSPR